MLVLLHLYQGLISLYLYLGHLQLGELLYLENMTVMFLQVYQEIFLLFFSDFRKSICLTLANALIYYEGLPFILKAFPKSFTFGEANIVIQGISLFIYTSFLRLNKILLHGVVGGEYNTATTVLQVGLLGILILCIVPFSFKEIRKVIPMYALGCLVVFSGIIPALNFILNFNPLVWLLEFFTNPERVI